MIQTNERSKESEPALREDEWTDPIVAEVRRVREKIAAEHDYDIDRIIQSMIIREDEQRRELARSVAAGGK